MRQSLRYLCLPKEWHALPRSCPPDLVSLKLPRLPDLPITPTQGHGLTYPVAGTGLPAHWGSPHNLGRTYREEQRPALSAPRALSTSWWTWGAKSLADCPVRSEEAQSSGRISETKEAPSGPQ